MNMPNSPRDTRLAREKLLLRYSDALDRGDFEAIGEILAAAEVDPELARMIDEMNGAFADEQSAPSAIAKRDWRARFRNKRTWALIASAAAVFFLLFVPFIPVSTGGYGTIAVISGSQTLPGWLISQVPVNLGAAEPITLGTATPFGTMVAQLQMTATSPLVGTPAPTLGVIEGTPAAMPTASPPGLGSPVAPQEPMIIKNGNIDILVEDAHTTINQVTQIAADGGGYVLASESSTEQGHTSATMTIGVRVEYFDMAMRRIREIALEVLDESTSGQDVSTEYVDLQSRLRNLEATRDRIKEFLDQAASVDEALNINQQLADIEAQIEQVKGRMTYLTGRAAYSTITVKISEYVAVTPTPTPTPTLTPTPTFTPTPTSPWSLQPRIDEAVETQTQSVRRLLEALVWLILVPGPYLIVLALFGLAVRAAVKRFW